MSDATLMEGAEAPAVEREAGTTRRKVLKRAVGGAAAAWAVPMVVGTSGALADPPGGRKCIQQAVAGGGTDCGVTCPACDQQCGTHPGGICCCFISVTGCCFCGANASCTDIACNNTSDCPPGHVCSYTCCGTTIQCVRTCLNANKPGQTAAPTGGQMQGTR